MRFSKIFQPQPDAIKRDKSVQAVHLPAQLLEKAERVELLNEIRDLAGAPPKEYQMYYQDLINRFAEFVQLLPAYAHPSHKWLDHQLRLAKTALKMREQFLLVGENLRPMMGEKEALWHYVVFSSALLRRVGLLFSHYEVSMCEEQGQHIAMWQPLRGAMKDQGSYYKLHNVTTEDKPGLDTMSQLIARQLMPAAGFAWIASDPAALMAWLGIVDGERGDGVSHRIVALSEKQLYELAKRETLLNELFRAESLEELLKAMQLSEQEVLALLPDLHGLENRDTPLAKELFDWLEKQNENNLLEATFEEAVFEGNLEKHYLISPFTLSFFATSNPTTIGNWFNVFKKALGLGFTALTSNDTMLGNFLAQSEKTMASKAAAAATTPQATEQTKPTSAQLFHQTLQDKAAPNAIPATPAQQAQVHQQNMHHTIETLNNQKGLMLGAMYGAGSFHAGEKAVFQTQQQGNIQRQNFLTQDKLITSHETQLQEVFQKQTQMIQQRQQEVRRTMEHQYHPEDKRSSFSYSRT